MIKRPPAEALGSGHGKEGSYEVGGRASVRSFGDKPDVLAIVELDEGVRLTTNIEAAPESIKVGMPVTVCFDDVTPERTLVKFKPASRCHSELPAKNPG